LWHWRKSWRLWGFRRGKWPGWRRLLGDMRRKWGRWCRRGVCQWRIGCICDQMGCNKAYPEDIIVWSRLLFFRRFGQNSSLLIGWSLQSH
jgi:hypothetical protein